jgi:tetratricopeptide (TPR) repeat protein
VAKERVSRKELKGPDEFVTLTAQVIEWAQKNRTTVTWVAGALAVLVVALVLGSGFRAARTREANDDLSRALLALRNDDMASAASKLKEVADRWSGSVQGQIAAGLRPSAELRAGQRDTVVADVQTALQSTPDLPAYLHQQLRLTWAVALENQSQWKEAADKYAEAAAGSGPYRGQAVLGEARAREQLGEKDRARELYRKYIEEFPDVPDRELIEAKTR